jgi:drug/metabolite transporter (DMT)-like permease
LSNSHHNLQNWILLLLLTIIWGSSYILIKKGLIAFGPLELALLRVGISFVCSLPFLPKAFSTVPWEKLPTLFVIGIVSVGLPAFLFALSMTKSESSVNGILNSLSPLWTILVGYYLFKVAITRLKVMGVIIGFLGAVVLVLGKSGAYYKVHVLYSLLPVVATFCYGLGTNITKQKLQNENPLYTTAVAMTIIGIPCIIALFFTGAPAKIAAGGAWLSLGCIALLSVFGTFIAWILFYRLVQRTDALFAASVTYLVPIVAISWGRIDGELLNLFQLLGFALIIVGVYFTTQQKNVSST